MPRARTAAPVLCWATAIAFSAGCGRTASDLEKADAFFQAKDYQAAALEYRIVLSKEPRNGPTHQKLARTYRALGQMPLAWGEFVRAADLLAADVAAQLDAAEALLATGQFEDARARADKALAWDSGNARAYTLRGLATAGLKDTDRAVDEIQKALALDPTRATNYANLGALQLALGRAEEAEAALRQAVALAPDTIEPHLALADFYWRFNKREQAESVLLQALRIQPTDPMLNRSLATLYIVTARSTLAEEPMKVYAANGGPEAQLLLADYYIGLNRSMEAVSVLASLTAVTEARAAAQARLAAIDYLQDRREAAYAKLEIILREEPRNVQVLVLKSRWQLGEHRLDEALRSANAAVAADPSSANAHYVLGNVQAARARPTDAAAAYADVLRQNPRAVPAQLALARMNSLIGQGATAVQLASALVQSDPENLDARLVLVQALRRQGDVVRAAHELQPLLAAAPKLEPVLTEAGEVALARQDLKAAGAHFDGALALDPDSYDAWVGRVNTSVAQNHVADAIKRIEMRLAKHPKDAATLGIAGRTYAIAGDLIKSETFLQHAIAADSGYMPAYYFLGQLYVRQKRLPEARQRYEEMVSQHPDNVGAHTMVAMLLQIENKPDEAKARYEKVLQIDPQAPVAANNLAYMKADAGIDLDVALSLARTALAAMPEEAEVNDTIGWVYFKRDMATLAVPPLEKSVHRVPNNATYRYHLGRAYFRTGDLQKAQEMLLAALKLDPKNADAAEARRLTGTP